MATLSAGLLTVLRCPVTGSRLVQEGEELLSTAPDPSGARVRYRLEEGIPVMLRPSASGGTSGVPAATD